MITRETVRGTYPVKPLGEVAEFLDSKRRPVKESDRKPGPYPYYGANGQQGTIDGYIFDEPLILLAEDGGHFGNPERGIAYRISGKSWVNNHAHIVKPKNGIDLIYLCRVLENYDVTPFISGSTRAKLTKGQAEKIEIPLPPLDEQKRIAMILDQADAIFRMRQRAIDRLNQLGRSIFYEMFGDPVTNPMGWEIKKLQEIGELDRGVSKHRPRNDPALLGGVYPLIQTGDVAKADGYVRSYSATYSDLGLKQSKLWQKGVLCITIAANIGETAILDFDACFPDSVVAFTPSESTTVEYVQYWMQCIQKRLEDIAPQSAQKNINLAILRELPIPVPAVSAQAKFGAVIREIDQHKCLHRNAISSADALFSSLQHRAFRGEL